MLHLVYRLVLASTQQVYCMNEAVVTPTTGLFFYCYILLLLPHKKNFYMPNYGNLYAFWAKKKKPHKISLVSTYIFPGGWKITHDLIYLLCRKSTWQVTQNTLLKFTYIINCEILGNTLSITRLSLSAKYRNDCFLTSGRCFKNQKNVYISLGLFEKKAPH